MFQAIGATEVELTSLHERLELLERRLSGVLVPTAPATQGANGGAPSRAVSETTERVARIGLGIQVATERVQGLLERLEV